MKTLAELSVGDRVMLRRLVGAGQQASMARQERVIVRVTKTTIKIEGMDCAFSRRDGYVRGGARAYIEPWDESRHPAMIEAYERAERRKTAILAIRGFDFDSLNESQLQSVSDFLAGLDVKDD